MGSNIGGWKMTKSVSACNENAAGQGKLLELGNWIQFDSLRLIRRREMDVHDRDHRFHLSAIT